MVDRVLSRGHMGSWSISLKRILIDFTILPCQGAMSQHEMIVGCTQTLVSWLIVSWLC